MASDPLGGGAGAAALTGATGVGTAYPRPCFLAARPQAVTGGHLCLQTPPDSSPIDCEVYNNAPEDAAGEAIESVTWMEGEAAGKASDVKDSGVEGLAKDKTAEAAEGGLGSVGEAEDNALEGVKSAGENIVDIAEGTPSKVAETAQDLDLGGKAKEPTEGAWDATKDAGQGVADMVDAAAAKDLS